MFMKNCWQVAAFGREVVAGQLFTRKICGDAVVFYRAKDGRVIDLITPETATSSHYFWAFARNFRLDEPAVTEFLRENVRRTFDEDKHMLEAQQRNIADGEFDKGFNVAIRADAGPTQGRRLLASMIEAEARGSTS